MELRIAAVTIIVEQIESAQQLNQILSEYGQYMIGRFGIPYRERGVNIICVVVEAPQDKISALSGKIGRLPGISAKTVYHTQKAKKWQVSVWQKNGAIQTDY